jgi:hypothetical protein
VFNDTLNQYSDEFPHPPEGLLLISTFSFLMLISCLTITLCIGKYYLIDSGYPNRKGFLAHYKGQRYHVPEFQGGILQLVVKKCLIMPIESSQCDRTLIWCLENEMVHFIASSKFFG